MLETIKQTIERLPKTNFKRFYSKYVTSVQDKNLEIEFKYLTSHNSLAILNLDRLINKYLGEMMTK